MKTAPAAADLEVVFIDLEASSALLDAAEHEAPRLSAAEFARIVVLGPDAQRQRLWRASRIALRIAIERIAGPAFRSVDFIISEHGRPSLGEGAPWFNVSHSAGAALIAVSNHGPVGVDLEHPRALKMALDRRQRIIAAAQKLTGARHTTTSDVDVLSAWVRLEAIAKALGTGIGDLLTEEGVMGGRAASDAPPAGSELAVRDLPVPQGYIGAIAASRLPSNVRVAMFPADAEALTRFLALQRG